MFTLTTRTRVKGSSQEADENFDLPSDEISPETTEADIFNAQWKPLHHSSSADMMMNADVLLPQWEDVWMAKVSRSNVDSDDKVLGYYHKIPMLNTILYDVQFPYGAINPYSENIIA